MEFVHGKPAVTRGSCWWLKLNRRAEHRFRQLLISTVKSVKIKLLLCCCIALTVVVLICSASAFAVWTNQSLVLSRYSASRFVDSDANRLLFLDESVVA